jgi:hypothetical protein
MNVPLFFPTARLVAHIDRQEATPLREVLLVAGAQCRASGPWTQRPIVIAPGSTTVEREPGDWGAVRVGVPKAASAATAARMASLVLAYQLMDAVARESVKGLDWARVRPPVGRPRSGIASTNAERQRLSRARKAAEVVAQAGSYVATRRPSSRPPAF